MRGKVPVHKRHHTGKGITPACAGKSPRPQTASHREEDHPRVCGEKPLRRRRGIQEMGSPPRVRGKAVRVVPVFDVNGITPACAGKSWLCSLFLVVPKDHPRVCGEKSMENSMNIDKQGSPPRVRGKDVVVKFHPILSGITPACAGKRRQAARRRYAGGDHPRVCGEKFFFLLSICIYTGSPPRVRGKVRAEAVNDDPTGITPACAGKR